MRIFKTISTTATTTETAAKAPKSDQTKIGHEIEERKKIREKRKCTNEIWLFLKDLTNRLNRVGLSIRHRLMVSILRQKRAPQKSSQCEKSVNKNTHMRLHKAKENGTNIRLQRRKYTLAAQHTNLLIYPQIKRKED